VYALRQRGCKVRTLMRRQEQADALEWMGATSVLGDLTGEWETVLTGTDAVIWAAGATSSGRFEEIDGQALMQVADRMRSHGPNRLVVVSSLGVDHPDEMPAFLRPVLRVKAASDAHVQASTLDYTIIRPGGLTNDPGSGLVEIGTMLPAGRIARADVAAVVVACLTSPHLHGQTIEVVSGQRSVTDAVNAFMQRGA